VRASVRRWLCVRRMGPVTTWAAASTVGLALMTGLYLDKRDDYASAVESCNSDKLAAVAEAERITRDTIEAAAARNIAAAEQQAEAARRARAIAEEARRQAEARPERVREVIRRVADADACIDTAVHGELVDSLRD